MKYSWKGFNFHFQRLIFITHREFPYWRTDNLLLMMTMTMIMSSIFFSGLDLRYVPGTRTFNPKSKSATRHSLDRTQSPIIKVHILNMWNTLCLCVSTWDREINAYSIYVLFLNRGRTVEHVFRNQGQISRNNLVLDKESGTKYQTKI